MKPATAPSAVKIQAVLGERFTVLEFEAGTRSAADAAAAIGCAVAEIAKSMIFRTVTSGRPSEGKRSGVDGEIGRANADFVREATGFAIGGVPPVGHARPPIVLIDETLLRFDNIWAAAGTPNAVFRLTPADLVAMTGGLVVDVVNG